MVGDGTMFVMAPGNADTSGNRANPSTSHTVVLDLSAVDEVRPDVVVMPDVGTASRATAVHRSMPGSSVQCVALAIPVVCDVRGCDSGLDEETFYIPPPTSESSIPLRKSNRPLRKRSRAVNGAKESDGTSSDVQRKPRRSKAVMAGPSSRGGAQGYIQKCSFLEWGQWYWGLFCTW